MKGEIKIRKSSRSSFTAFLAVLLILPFWLYPAPAAAQCCACPIEIPKHHDKIQNHVDDEFSKHRDWLVDTFFRQHVLPAMQLMTEQITATMMQQVEIIGAMFDAKHQLESQRLFQQLQAEAHRDYRPSKQMCVIGTNMRSLAASEESARLATLSFSSRLMQRILHTGANISSEGPTSDERSRTNLHNALFCSPSDNANGMSSCQASDSSATHMNVNFGAFASPLTLDMDVAGGGAPGPQQIAAHEFANLIYANSTTPIINPTDLATPDGKVRPGPARQLLNYRHVAAGQSLAAHSLAVMYGMKAPGSGEVGPFMNRVMADMGIPDTDVQQMLGARPSQYAQLEVLMKWIYQNPNFYTGLYDTPANNKRKSVALLALENMQKYYALQSLQRTEVLSAVMLESLISQQLDKISNKLGGTSPTGAMSPNVNPNQNPQGNTTPNQPGGNQNNNSNQGGNQ